MKKWIWLVLAVIIGVSVGGYSYARHNKEMQLYAEAMQRGNSKIADKNYSEAEVAFQDALMKKANDPKATRYLKQTQNFATAESRFGGANYQAAQIHYKRAANMKNGQKTLTQRAQKKVKLLKSVISNRKGFNDIYKTAKKQAKEGKYTTSNETLDLILTSPTTKQKYYKDIVKKAQQLHNSNVAVLNGTKLIEPKKDSKPEQPTTRPTDPATNNSESDSSSSTDTPKANSDTTLTPAENKAADNYKGKNEYTVSQSDKEVNGKTITDSQITDARNLFKSDGMDADAMSDQDIRNAIKGAAQNHQSLQEYAKNNGF